MSQDRDLLDPVFLNLHGGKTRKDAAVSFQVQPFTSGVNGVESTVPECRAQLQQNLGGMVFLLARDLPQMLILRLLGKADKQTNKN